MLRFSRMTDYAVVLMIQIAKQTQESSDFINAACLSSQLNLPLPTVSKILKLLLNSGLLDSVRGAKGGYKLARDASKIKAGDIINAIEGVPALAACVLETNCQMQNNCPLSANWQKLSLSLQSFLQNISLDILARCEPMEIEFNFKILNK